ncbi:MAG: hypothetical protein ABSA13_12365 [Beijerinckiaceae bacterium]|jgi:hypothetical protein
MRNEGVIVLFKLPPWASIFGAALLASSAYAAGPIKPLSIGNWSGGAYTDDATGAFSHCVLGATYASGIYFLVSVNRNFGWSLGFTHQNWQLSPGQTIPIDLTFDGRGPFHVYGSVVPPRLVVVQMPTTSELIRRFRGASQMTAFANGQLFQFALTNTAQTLPALVRCVHENIGEPVAATPKKPRPVMRSAAPMPQTAPAAPTVSSPNPEVTEAEVARQQQATAAEQERDRLLKEAAAEHDNCLRTQMREIVPFSNESAETLAQVVITKCSDAEKKYVSLGMAFYGAAKADMEKVVRDAVAERKKSIVAEIVTFRADMTKALSAKPKESGNVPKTAKPANGI